MPNDTTPADRPRVVHFVTGGFSGATQVAVDLCLAALRGGPFQPVLVLRRKSHTPMARVEALRALGLVVHLVASRWWHRMTIGELAALLREIRPVALLAHGFPEHLIGRQAGLDAGVPVLIQVEHNSRERYSPWSLWLSRRLARRSAALVGVSEGVRQRLIAQGLPPEKTIAIPNGIDLSRFAAPGGEREAGLVMSARFARQKDHATLIAALARLVARGLTPPLQLAGTGPLMGRMQAQVARYGLQAQVRFLGHHADMPGLLRLQRIFVLATHFEGMPLALVEAMASGCACIASDVIGVHGVLDHERTGLLVPEGDADALAAAIERLLLDPALADRLGTSARERALAEHGQALMRQRYDALLAQAISADRRPSSANHSGATPASRGAADTRPLTAVQLQLNGMGDLVWHAQYFRCVAEQSRGGQISLIAPPTTMAREIIGHEPWLREIIDFDRRPRRSEHRRGRHSGLDGLWRFGAELAPKRFERMVLFSDHPGRAILVCWRAGIRTIIGFGDTWLQRRLLTKTPWIQRYRGPAVAGYKDATNFSLAQGFCQAPIVPRISVRPDALARMQQRLAALPRPLHVLAIGASEPYKQWGADNFVELSGRLAARGHGVLLLGGPAEATLAKGIRARIDPALRHLVQPMTDASIADSVAAVSLAQTCVGNDTGAIQFAAAVCRPAIVVLGPRPALEHDPEHIQLLQAAQLSDISAAEVEARVLASLR